MKYIVVDKDGRVLAHKGKKNGVFWVNGQGKEPEFVDETDAPIITDFETAKIFAAKLGGTPKAIN